ncbi:MAG: response regulator [Candidatus Sulfotelmatobacter sp.]
MAPFITIVDDDSLVRRAILRLVKSVGLEVDGFPSAEEFLQAHSLRDPDCLILDIGLPGMSGLDLQKRLVETRRTPPIIFVTARDEAEVRAQALQAGAFAFLGKPFSDEVLLQAIRTSLQPDAVTREAIGRGWP